MTRTVIAALLAVAGPASAEPLDELGFGAAATATANTRAAIAVGAEAVHVDPAGVALAARPEVLVGYQTSRAQLEINDRDAGVTDARGTSLGLAIPFAIAD